MKIHEIHILILAFFFMGTASCTKQQDDLDLDADYLQVADVLEYCQGNCTEQPEWEGAEILVKGYVPDVADEALMQELYQKQLFYLNDIRNGMFIEVRVEGDLDAIFAFLAGLIKTDQVLVRGTSQSVIVNEGDECMKGVVILIDNVEHIQINQ
jgi:hypothetical protein